jgi:hypothetical protein
MMTYMILEHVGSWKTTNGLKKRSRVHGGSREKQRRYLRIKTGAQTLSTKEVGKRDS